MYQGYIVIDNKIVTAYCSSNMNEAPPEHFVEWDLDLPVAMGSDIREYDENKNLRPISERILDGLVVLPEGYKVEDENIVPKTHYDMVVEGTVALGTQEYLDHDKKEVVQGTLEECVVAGRLTESEALEIYLADFETTKLMLTKYVTSLGNNPILMGSLSQTEIQELVEYRQSILDVQAPTTYVEEIVWPAKPSSIQ